MNDAITYFNDSTLKAYPTFGSFTPEQRADVARYGSARARESAMTTALVVGGAALAYILLRR